MRRIAIVVAVALAPFAASAACPAPTPFDTPLDYSSGIVHACAETDCATATLTLDPAGTPEVWTIPTTGAQVDIPITTRRAGPVQAVTTCCNKAGECVMGGPWTQVQTRFPAPAAAPGLLP